jgi:hypothetical protein
VSERARESERARAHERDTVNVRVYVCVRARERERPGLSFPLDASVRRTLRPGSVALCDLDGSRVPPLVWCGLQLIGVGGTSRVLDIIRSNRGVGMCCGPLVLWLATARSRL